MKKQKQPVDRELVDRSFLSRIEPYLYLLPFLLRETPFLGGFALTFGFFGFSLSFCFRRLRKSAFLFRDFVCITLMGGIACRGKA